VRLDCTVALTRLPTLLAAISATLVVGIALLPQWYSALIVIAGSPSVSLRPNFLAYLGVPGIVLADWISDKLRLVQPAPFLAIVCAWIFYFLLVRLCLHCVITSRQALAKNKAGG
jgi:hypothetical protein